MMRLPGLCASAVLILLSACDKDKVAFKHFCSDWQNIAAENANDCNRMAERMLHFLDNDVPRVSASALRDADENTLKVCKSAAFLMLSQCRCEGKMQNICQRFRMSEELKNYSALIKNNDEPGTL